MTARGTVGVAAEADVAEVRSAGCAEVASCPPDLVHSAELSGSFPDAAVAHVLVLAVGRSS